MFSASGSATKKGGNSWGDSFFVSVILLQVVVGALYFLKVEYGDSIIGTNSNYENNNQFSNGRNGMFMDVHLMVSLGPWVAHFSI